MIPIPTNIRTEDIPDIPKTLVEEVGKYTNFRSAVLADFSDTSMFILTRFGDSNQVHSVAGPLMARRQLTFFSDPVAGAKKAPNENWIVFWKDIGGGEFYQLYRLDLITGASKMLTDGKSRNIFGAFSRFSTGKKIAFLSTKR